MSNVAIWYCLNGQHVFRWSSNSTVTTVPPPDTRCCCGVFTAGELADLNRQALKHQAEVGEVPRDA